MNKNILCLDWGKKKVGLASSDEQGVAISEHAIYHREAHRGTWTLDREDTAYFKEFIEKYEISLIVIGANKNQEKESAKLMDSLTKELQLPVTAVNEYLSTWEAGASKLDDSRAARVILEDYHEQQKRSGKTLVVVSLLLLFLIASFLFVSNQVNKFKETSFSSSAQEFTLKIKKGDTLTHALKKIEQKTQKKFNKLEWKIYLKFFTKKPMLRFGEFEIDPALSKKEIIDHLLKGKVKSYRFTIREGLNVWDIEKVLKSRFKGFNALKFKSLAQDWSKLNFLPSINPFPQARFALEGFLSPETYTYDLNTNTEQIVDRMLEHFKKEALPILKKHPWAKESNGIFKLITLASIVEKESGNFKEQPTIASVFWNRINKGMPLQSDPTTIYPLFPNFNGNITRKDLRRKNHYNTYRIPGLPIGPICSPGISAIKAVVNPKKTPYFFFVARGNGYHAFSKTYKQHKKYVYEYQIRKRK